MQLMQDPGLKILLYRRGMSLAQLASLLDVNPGTVTRWAQRKPPPARALEIEKATRGEISRSDLRPDIWPVSENAA